MCFSRAFPQCRSSFWTGALAASPFQFDQKDVAITQGKLEGVFAWTTVNFLLGNLDAGSRSSATAGIIDLGGGSTQVSRALI